MTKDMSFSGSGIVAAGDYGSIRCSGSCIITGDISCTSIHCSGSVHCAKNILSAGNVHTSGSFHCQGNVKANDLKSSGSTHIDGKLECKNMGIYGSAHIGKDIIGESITISGTCVVGGNVESISFSVCNCNISGYVKADKISIYMSEFARCSIESIKGGSVFVRFDDKNQFNRAINFFGKIITTEKKDFGVLTVSVIEGEDIYLENTTAKLVQGNKVSIGRGCNIEKVVYKVAYEADPNSKVNEVEKKYE